ncbi:MAG TPA: NADP-dependent phosphogluconate dehydrogenase [Vicinamibacterales bacterium]|nr:NADP-dependent phosphogluconate dehydrogenase [Vicinamibacterales bacterium]
MTAAAAVGVLGLGTMGRNLALNVESRGFPVAVWNREQDWTEAFVHDHAARRFTGTASLDQLVAAVHRPRRLLMMIPAGAPVDEMIGRLAPLLDEGDVLIDGGNSWFEDTRRREAELRARGIHFVGCGVSGGERGAREGPSLMPGGSAEAWALLRDILEAIAARTESGPCVTHVGPDGAGHFVKMVHNGIEYADMQLIAESWDMMRRSLGLSTPETGEVFARWNDGPLASFLVELTAAVCRVMDPESGAPLVDMILDRAGQKGTGRWTSQVALDLGVSHPTIAAAIDARVLSSMKDERVAASSVISGPRPEGTPPAAERETALADLHDALLAARICAYAQGMALIQAASAQYAWSVQLAEIARIWKGGCIIRARLLDPVRAAFDRDPVLPNLLVDPAMAATIADIQEGWRRVIARSAAAGIPLPAHASALAYFDSYRTADLPQNLTQAQRDAFGAHTYERRDRAGHVHTDW